MLDDMRLALLGLVVAACGGGDDSPSVGSDGSGSAQAMRRLDLPRLDESARVTVLSTKVRPPALVWIDHRGRLAMGKVDPTWAGDITPPAEREPEDVDIAEAVLEAVIDGPKQPFAETARKLLEERRAERRRRGGRPMLPRPSRDPAMPAVGRLDNAPAVDSFTTLDKLSPLVLATPSAPAPAVIAVLRKVGGTLAVDHLGKLAVLDVAFAGYQEPAREIGVASWLEVSVDTKGIHVERYPEQREITVAWNGAAIDRKQLEDARKKLEGADLRVDVVVRPDTTAQTLVELLAALQAIGVKRLAVAEGPDSADERKAWYERARRGLPGYTVALPGQPTAQGDLDKTTIRDTVRKQLPQIQLCYEKVLIGKPGLQGTLQIEFFIQPDGKVGAVTADGVDPDVDDCVAKIIKGLEFPKPDGGGGVQVRYPFTFRSSN